ncbi:hypothetical protein UACE39S_02448 [Ureibacillus acetophenoni]
MKILLSLLLLIFIVGCSEQSTDVDTVSKTNKEDGLISVPNETNTFFSHLDNEETKLYKEFAMTVPKAVVISKVMFDINNDSEKDLIIIYSTPEDKTNFAIITRYNVNAIGLNGEDTNFQFSDAPELLKVLENPNRFIIKLYDKNKDFNFQLEIKMEFDKEKNENNIIIKSLT